MRIRKIEAPTLEFETEQSIFHVLSTLMCISSFAFFDSTLSTRVATLSALIIVNFYEIWSRLYTLEIDRNESKKSPESKWLYAFIFLFMLALGLIPTIMNWNLTDEFYNKPHWYLNVVFIPAITCVAIYYFIKLNIKLHKIDNNILTVGRNSTRKYVGLFLKLFIQAIIPWAFSFFNRFNKNIAEIANTLIGIWQVVFWMIMSCFIVYYIVIFLKVSFKETKAFGANNIIYFDDLFPKWFFMLFPIYFVIWGMAAFYPHANRLEGIFYFGVIIYITFVLLVTGIMAFSLFTQCVKKIRNFFIIQSVEFVLIGLYAFAVFNIESYKTPFTQIVTHENTNVSDMKVLIGANITILALVTMIILFILTTKSKSIFRTHEANGKK